MEIIFDLLCCLLTENHREKNTPRWYGNKNTLIHTLISVCVFAHTCIWDSETWHRGDPVLIFLPQTHSEAGGTRGFYWRDCLRAHVERTNRSAALCAQRDCGLPGFPHPFPLHRWSLVRPCSQSKPRAYPEIKIIINLSFAPVSPRWGFGLVHTPKI